MKKAIITDEQKIAAIENNIRWMEDRNIAVHGRTFIDLAQRKKSRRYAQMVQREEDKWRLIKQ